MPTAMALLAILGTLLIGAISPGPSFILVVRTAIAVSRWDGLAAALGMGLGGITYATLALLGLQAILAHVGWAYLVLKIGGGLYLVYLGWRLWRGARQPLAFAPGNLSSHKGFARSIAVGLAVQIGNPKTAIVYAGVFAAFLPARPADWLFFVLPPLVFCIEAGWYALVAFAFSADRPRTVYLCAKIWVDRVAGGLMGFLGARLLFDALPRR